jgi:hypothetical protein
LDGIQSIYIMNLVIEINFKIANNLIKWKN